MGGRDAAEQQDGSGGAPPLLCHGRTHWRQAPAGRVAFLIDNQAYFRAVAAALRAARCSVLILGWQFHPRTRLDPAAGGAADPVGPLLTGLAEARPGLKVRILIWDAALGVALGKRMMPQRGALWFRGSPVRYVLDGDVPWGAAHHQKIVVIDDRVAFCAGDDLTGNRWDRGDHFDIDPDRRTPWQAGYPPRHGLAMLVDGPAARALGGLARARWLAATGEWPDEPGPFEGPDPWPAGIAPDLTDTKVAISRTAPARDGQPAIRENEALFLAGIGAARRLLYLENQYFASRRIGEALARRLAEPDGPEIVLVTGRQAPSFFDRAAMDPARDALIARLRAADAHRRFHAFAPHAAGGRPIIVHSKLMIVDDHLVRIGSSNLAERSLAWDTECDLSVAMRDAGEKAVAARLRARLVGHFLDRPAEAVAAEAAARGSLAAAIDALDSPARRRLARLEPAAPGFPRSLVARFHLGDPHGADDAWRPWRRRA